MGQTNPGLSPGVSVLCETKNQRLLLLKAVCYKRKLRNKMLFYSCYGCCVIAMTSSSIGPFVQPCRLEKILAFLCF